MIAQSKLSARDSYQSKAAPTAEEFLLKLNGAEKADGKNRKTAAHLIQRLNKAEDQMPVFAKLNSITIAGICAQG